MKFQRLFVLLPLISVLLSGCKKPAASALATSPTNSVPTDTVPTHGQGKLRTMKIYVGAETLETELALTPQQEQIGMMFRTNIQDTDSMIFVLPFPQRASFWMKNCPESISAAYITADGIIQEIHHLEQNNTNSVVAAREDIQFVLETSEGWFTRHHIEPGTAIRTEKGSLAETFLRR